MVLQRAHSGPQCARHRRGFGNTEPYGRTAMSRGRNNGCGNRQCGGFGSRCRLEVVNADINTFGSTGVYQLIVSNPPYYSNGAVSTDDSRAGARHQNSLTFGNLLEAVGRLIAADGCFAMVTPPDAEADILFAAELSRLYLRRLCRVATTPARPCRRLLWEFSRSAPGRVSEQTLLLRDASGQPSLEYSSLVDGFYLRIH